MNKQPNWPSKQPGQPSGGKRDVAPPSKGTPKPPNLPSTHEGMPSGAKRSNAAPRR